MSKKTLLFVIDYQNDFCDPKGSLFVGGANDDVVRATSFLSKYQSKIDGIYLTQDSHYVQHVAHGNQWVNDKNQHPAPFTIIEESDVLNGVWHASHPLRQKDYVAYVKELTKNNRFKLCIWPEHCLIGTWGHGFVPSFAEAVVNWSRTRKIPYNVTTKGSNIRSEHYGAIEADVPDDNDASTKTNTVLIDNLQRADDLIIMGEASTHCVLNTLRQVAKYGAEHVKKFIIFSDTMSPVPIPVCLDELKKFNTEMANLGARFTNTKDFLF
jgi:nicotinamidase/pyrazinamidase